MTNGPSLRQFLTSLKEAEDMPMHHAADIDQFLTEASDAQSLTDQRMWEVAVLRECVQHMPATGDCADFMSVVSTAMITLRGESAQSLTEKIAEAVRPHAWEYPDSFCECKAFIRGWESYVQHLAQVILETP